MSIIEKNYQWKNSLSKRSRTEYIVLHHAAATKCSADDIHRMHLNKGWAGIGYHFYVTKDGSIYRGRPIDTLGAQVTNYNDKSLGICFEGNFENEAMNEAQLKSGRWLINYLKVYYPSAKIVGHRDLNATACPGKNFPFDEVIKAEITDAETILREKVGLADSTIEFLKAYKYGNDLIEKIARAVKG